MLILLIRVIFTIFILITSQPGSSLFSWHPTCMILAYGLIFFEGVRVFSSKFYTNVNKPLKITIHWILQVSALSLALIGFLVIFYSKILKNKWHFQTWHAIFGLVTILMTLAECMGGILAKYSFLLKKFVKPLTIKRAHALSSILTFSLSAVSIITGMNSKWFLRVTSDYHPLCKVFVIIPVILTILISFRVLRSFLPPSKGNVRNGD
ncbi:transmembrane reductase CYB561D2 [Centruroides vittatus]|uniref:transmembrane reductase CYB561D2 n=1 Tax=Centruroides vittatus TaxID=120091 RepID=UPI00350E93A0